jgi:polar amino acid transport system permease protein
VASLWYLLFTSVLMVGQHFIEKRFSRGTGRIWTGKGPTTPEAAAAIPGAPGVPLGTDFGGKG